MLCSFRTVITTSLVAAAASMLTSTEPAGAATQGGICNPTRVKFLASDRDTSSTGSANFVNLPEGVVTFTQGGPVSSCVIVTFSASVNPQGAKLFIRAFLDNATAALPSEFEVEPGNANTSNSFAFIFPSVSPGSHTVRIQYRSGDAPAPVLVRRHNTIVIFKP